MKRRNTITIAGGLAIILLLALVITNLKSDNQPEPATANNSGTRCLKSPAKQESACPVRLELAQTDAMRIKGLSGHNSLSDEQGMLFEFDQTGTRCMWMKDMRFPIDILWLDGDNKILKIEPNISPETYPASYCADNTKQVVELSAGNAGRLGLHSGEQIVVD